MNKKDIQPGLVGIGSDKEDKCACCHRSVDEQFRKTGIFKEYKDLPELPQIIEAGKQCGYAIVAHGSMTRDIDLLAVPWVDEAVSPEELINNICSVKPLKFFVEEHQKITIKPFGRMSQVITVGGENTYIDLSIISKFGSSGKRPIIKDALDDSLINKFGIGLQDSVLEGICKEFSTAEVSEDAIFLVLQKMINGYTDIYRREIAKAIKAELEGK